MNKGKIAVTGGSGKAGKWIVRELIDHGYEVVNLDSKLPEESLCRTILTDLTDAGQVHNALSSFGGRDRRPVEAVIHFAAIPQAFTHPNDVVFRTNVMSTYNILEACANLTIRKAVLASSESSYGICFASEFFEPRYLPVDEEHPQLPEDSYGLSKVVNEQTGETFHRRTGMQVVSFRLGNILEPSDYERVIGGFDKPEQRRGILWSYIDVRDVASACRLAIEKEGLGAQALILAADDTSSNLPTEELAARYLPGVKEFRQRLDGRSSFLSNEKAKQLLGWRQQHYLQDGAEF
ncbi:NAD(P)-dependent oxidoreductase [Paenibacillus aurantius]|uniref:NAD(P)-dependent oxidoreductase n=1 Tax=Paenibacillus aurantius TaxID=2918900 RepID=A0AA96LA36_9BACL|nr:NAD(P)-dependent oxidoreductase [Paenibacillus aurantius]WNQ09802.1 NAD(P)-dependent oxidoreductase [Paenibacillus aurantius]